MRFPSPDTSAIPPAAGAPRDAGRLDRSLVVLALVLTVGATAAGLDATIVNVAIDSVGASFHSPVAAVQWVSTAYLLSLTAVVPLTAWVVERFGARRSWLAALGVFGLGSVLCGVSWSLGSLVAFRVVQGLGGGLLLPLIRTILAQAAGPQRLGRVMAFVIVPGSFTPVLGPVVGGLLTQQLGWRWAFLVNVPVVLVGLLLAAKVIPAGGRSGRRVPIDVPGLTLLVAGPAALVYGLAEAGTGHGFGALGVRVALTAGVALLGAYVWYALRTSAVPVVDVRLFRNRSFAAAATLVFLLGGSLFAALLVLPLYYQQVLGTGPLAAGLLLAPLGLGMGLAMTVVGRLVDRVGGERGIVVTGTVLAAGGLVPFAFAATAGPLVLASAQFVTGLGIGTVLLASVTATYRGVSRELTAAATSATRILQQVGGVLGTALVSIVLARAGAGAPPAEAYAAAFCWVLAFTAVAVVPALLLPRRRRA